MTPREPDRFEAKAKEIADRHIVKDYTYVGVQKQIAAALRAAEAEALKRAAQRIAWIQPEYTAHEAQRQIRALASPAAAPAAETCPFGGCVNDAPLSEPAAPSLSDALNAMCDALCDVDAPHVAGCTMIRQRIAELEAAIRWACGEEGEFPTRQPGEGAYWWRTELRKRAGGRDG